MRIAQSETSLDAYHSLPVAGYLQPKEQQVMAAFKGRADTFTRQQLVDVVGMPLHCVCGRINSLLSKRALRDRLDYAVERGATKSSLYPTPTTNITEGTHGGQLNPTWVEWLMGWPLGWSELKPLEMDKFRSWRQQHGDFSKDG